MQDVSGLVTITVTSIVLDVPDHSGRYIASDLIAGWAYLLADHQGDVFGRGQGVCPGSLETALSCAFLAAASQAKDATEIGVLVENKKAHHIFVGLARSDARVRAAASGRSLTVMTRPHSRAIRSARAAAERVAIAALREEKPVPTLTVAKVPRLGVAAAAPRARIIEAARELRVAAEWGDGGSRDLPSSQNNGGALAIRGQRRGSRPAAFFRWMLAPVLQFGGILNQAEVVPSRLTGSSARWFGDLSQQAAGIDEVFREAGWP
jgi:hypothetical protein